jgi:hypothetical protein
MVCPEHGAAAAVNMEPSSTRERRSSTGSGTGRMYVLTRPVGRSGDRWLVVLQHVAGHVSAPPHTHNAVAIHPLRPSTAGHPDSRRSAHSAHTYRDRDTVRWSKWNVFNVGRVRSLGDGVPGTWYGFGCTMCAQCAQSVHKGQVCTRCHKSAQ